MNRKCSNYKIYKFNVVITRMSQPDTSKISNERWQRAEAHTQFKIKLINALAPENFEALLNRYTPYGKALGLKTEEYISPRNRHVFGAYEIGLDMLHTKYGLLQEHHWMYTYYLVPKDQQVLIDFFENNKPSWVTNVKRI